MQILAVGDSYMPVRYFEQALKDLEQSHAIDYIDVVADPDFSPATSSELRVREYLGSPRQLVSELAEVEILVVHGAIITDEVIDAGRELRLICCARGGPVNIDAEAAAARGIPVVTTPGKNAEAVADQTLAFVVMLARGFPRAQAFLLDGHRLRDNWEGVQFMGQDLRGHTLGLVGYGRVGQRVAARAAAYGMHMLVYDPFVSIDSSGDLTQVDTLEELLRRADFVTLHARASAANLNLINSQTLAQMRQGAFLVNTARETLVDEDALAAALDSGHLAGAALDVFYPTEHEGRHRLLDYENVILTPHIGGATAETLLQGADMIADEIRRFTSNEPMRNVSNREVASR